MQLFIVCMPRIRLPRMPDMRPASLELWRRLWSLVSRVGHEVPVAHLRDLIVRFGQLCGCRDCSNRIFAEGSYHAPLILPQAATRWSLI